MPARRSPALGPATLLLVALAAGCSATPSYELRRPDVPVEVELVATRTGLDRRDLDGQWAEALRGAAADAASQALFARLLRGVDVRFEAVAADDREALFAPVPEDLELVVRVADLEARVPGAGVQASGTAARAPLVRKLTIAIKGQAGVAWEVDPEVPVGEKLDPLMRRAVTAFADQLDPVATPVRLVLEEWIARKAPDWEVRGGTELPLVVPAGRHARLLEDRIEAYRARVRWRTH